MPTYWWLLCPGNALTMSSMFGGFEPVAFLTDVSKHEGRALELLLAASDKTGSRGIGGAIIDAAYVLNDPPLLARLAESGTPWVPNPQSVRFCGTRSLSVAGIRDLPYVPQSPLSPVRFGEREKRMVRGALEFQAEAEPAAYMVPALPVARASIRVFRAFQELHTFAADVNGTKGIPYRPMLAACFPSYAVMRVDLACSIASIVSSLARTCSHFNSARARIQSRSS